jgi:hypothetical protein
MVSGFASACGSRRWIVAYLPGGKAIVQRGKECHQKCAIQH